MLKSKNRPERGPPLALLSRVLLSAFVADAHRTESIPEDQQGAVFSGPDTITALRIRGVSIEHPLLVSQREFSFGSMSTCQIQIERPRVSHSHGLLEREQGRIRVTDLASKNGIAFLGRRMQQFHISPGDWFSIGETVLYALNEDMRAQHPILTEIIGPRLGIVDDLLMEAVHGRHVFIKAEAGSDQERLGQAIHLASLRRRHHWVAAGAGSGDPPGLHHVQRARHGTLLLRLDSGSTKLDPAFIEAVAHPEYNVRLLVCARSFKEAIDGITEELMGRAYRVEILPLRERAGEIATLLERRFVDRRSRLRFTDFTDDNQRVLQSYGWPENLEEVREAADRSIELSQADPDASVRRAAVDASIPRTNLTRWLDKLGLSWPLFRTPDTSKK